MAPNKAYMITLASVMLLNSGCSGGRLRNLISRSDYQSLEELDAQDDLYGDRYDDDSPITGRQQTVQTVSQQQELSDEESNSRFSISRLFKGKKPDADFGEDPFLRPEITESVSETRDLAERSSSRARGMETKAAETVASTANQFSNTLSDVEKQAEDMFDDLSNATDSATSPFAATSSFAEAKDSVKESVQGIADKAVSTTSSSFSDFMAQRAERKTAAAPETEVVFAEPAEERPDFNNHVAGDTGFDFDSLMSDSDSDFTPPTRPSTPEPKSDMFPELDDMFTETASANEPAFDSPASDTAPNPFEQAIEQSQDDTADLTHDPYSLASQKHGFGPLGKQDPWAAFDSDVPGDEISWAVGVEKKDEEAGFDWGQPPASEYESLVQNDANATADNQFMQVASSSTSDDFGNTGSDSSTGSLVIPVPAQMPESETSFLIPEPVSEQTQDDYFGSAEDFQLAEVPVEDVNESEEVVSTGGLAAITGWPVRKWFFLLGCILVAILLFLPNRQNQKN